MSLFYCSFYPAVRELFHGFCDYLVPKGTMKTSYKFIFHPRDLGLLYFTKLLFDEKQYYRC